MGPSSRASGAFDKLDRALRQHQAQPADLRRVFAGGIAGLRTRRDAFENHREAEQGKSVVEGGERLAQRRVPVIILEMFLLVGNPERVPVESDETSGCPSGNRRGIARWHRPSAGA